MENQTKNYAKAIAIGNQKGGVGKTTYTSCIAYVLAKMGYKVLCIDLDSQSSLSSLLNVFPSSFDLEEDPVYGIQDILEYVLECEDNHNEVQYSAIEHAIVRPQFKTAIRVKYGDDFKTDWKYEDFGFDLIPSDTSLANYNQLLPQRRNGGFAIYKVIKIIKENSDYDFILCDLAPSLDTVSYAGLAGCTEGIIIPINLEIMALRGTRNIVSAVAEIQRLMLQNNIKHNGILGLLKSRYVKRYKIQQDFDEVVKDFFPIHIFSQDVPSSTNCDKAHAKGWLFAQYDKKIYAIFETIVKEVIDRANELSDLKEPIIIESVGKEAENLLEMINQEEDTNE